MIVLILRGLLAVARFVFGLLPTWTPPDLSGASTAIADARVWQYLAWANHYLPLDLALVLVALRLAIWLGLYAFDALVWILARAHILGAGAE